MYEISMYVPIVFLEYFFFFSANLCESIIIFLLRTVFFVITKRLTVRKYLSDTNFVKTMV